MINRLERLATPRALKILATLVVVLSIFGAGVGVYTVSNYGSLSQRTKVIEHIVDTNPHKPGVQGTPGARGRRGKTGSRGPRGFRGLVGPRGAQGFQGPRGFSVRGPRGFTGARGPQGPRGLLGLGGPPGPVGPLPSAGELLALLCQESVTFCTAAKTLP